MNVLVHDQERLARSEAVCNKLRSEMDDVMKKAYETAVEAGDKESAAELARKIRNKLLDESDKECALDRLLEDAPDGVSFSDWITWLRKLAGAKSSAWGVYRQSLRDLPKQDGFPLKVVFPEKPTENQ